ncbi:MAG: Na/Pi cotransporter family protein, partial [Bdellovibrio sp.]
SYDSPSVLLAHAEREVLRMADIVLSMVKDSFQLFKGENKDLYEDIKERDNKVDLLNREISLFLTQHMENSESTDYDQMIRLISFVADLESAADVVDKNIVHLAGKKQNLKVDFSQQGWDELKKMHQMVVELMELSILAFQRKDPRLGEQVLYLKRKIRVLEKNLRETHIERLIAGKKESINTSSIHMDVLAEYRRIAGLMSNHVYSLVGTTDRYSLLHKTEE